MTGTKKVQISEKRVYSLKHLFAAKRCWIISASLNIAHTQVDCIDDGFMFTK